MVWRDRIPWKINPGLFWYVHAPSTQKALTSILSEVQSKYSPVRSDLQYLLLYLVGGEWTIQRPIFENPKIGSVYHLLVTQNILNYSISDNSLGRETYGNIDLRVRESRVDASSRYYRQGQYGFSLMFNMKTLAESFAERDFFVNQ